MTAAVFPRDGQLREAIAERFPVYWYYGEQSRLAREYGVTRERIRQIGVKLGLVKLPPMTVAAACVKCDFPEVYIVNRGSVRANYPKQLCAAHAKTRDDHRFFFPRPLRLYTFDCPECGTTTTIGVRIQVNLERNLLPGGPINHPEGWGPTCSRVCGVRAGMRRGGYERGSAKRRAAGVRGWATRANNKREETE